jgi:hypothetical protein
MLKKTMPGKLDGVINGLGGKTVHLEFFLEEKWLVRKTAQTENVLLEKWIGEKWSKQENGSMVTHPGGKWLHGITGDGLTARYENEIEVMRRIWLLISHDVLIYMYIYYSISSLTQLEV